MIRGTPGCSLIPPVPTRVRMAELCAQASVVAVPSVEPEAFGLVSIEAQAMGTPVVASNIGGLSESVSCRSALVAPGDSHSLERALTTVVSDHLDPTGLRRWVAERFQARTSAERLERALYRARRAGGSA